MYQELFTLHESNKKSIRTQHWGEQLWVLLLFVAAILLYQMDLGILPLRDWDEGIVAGVARDIYQGSLDWLYPTSAGEPYFNKPPLLHLLIAWAYFFGGVNEWTTRLPGAMLSALSVPLLYGIAREVFRLRSPAIFSALVYLTLLPVVRHGRLAMLDGGVQCFFLLMVWCLLRSRRDLRWGLGVGIGLGLICMTKGMMGVLLGTIALAFTVWDTPRLLRSWYLWIGIALGMTPVTLWYLAQWQHYGDAFLSAHFGIQSLQRVWAPVESNAGPPWYYLLELLKYSWPWFLFLPQGLQLAWENRTLSWAKLVGVWTSIYFVAITVMGTKLPWYVLPLYPAVALACGAKLAQVWADRKTTEPFTRDPLYPVAWIAILGTLSVVLWGGSFYLGVMQPNYGTYLPVLLISVALTLSVSALLIYHQDRQFVLILFWGMFVSLCLFVASPHWIWELNEAYPVKPVAEAIAKLTPPGEPIYTSFPYHRPSLNFYSDRRVIPATPDELQQYWQDQDHPYFLIDRPTLEALNLESSQTQSASEGWLLVTPKSQ